MVGILTPNGLRCRRSVRLVMHTELLISDEQVRRVSHADTG